MTIDGPNVVEVTVLGSGTSHGVPMIGCGCGVCRSDDPRDQRHRPSLFVRSGGQGFLIDTTPELRIQCIAHDIDRVDAVLLTHHHADHITGLDDLRRFNWLMHKPVPLYGSERTLTHVREMFRYAFDPAPDSPHSRPEFELHTIDAQAFCIDGQLITPLSLMHGPLPVLGFRFGRFAYCTDCNFIPEESFDRLEGLDVLILDALRRTPHPAHFNLEEAIEIAHRVGARQTYFTHITHQLGHEQTNSELPQGMALAYDGLRFEVG